MTIAARKIFKHIWPVERFEIKKFIPMLILCFCIGFIYNMLRNAKDTLVVTGQASGAEIIPFIKVWVMLPSAVFMTAIFSWLSNHMRLEKVFYVIISIFIVFFSLFTFILYPHAEALHMHSVGDFLASSLPKGFSGFISMIRYWSFTLFYVMSEMWSCIVLSILFWGFANEVTTVKEAKRFYALFGIGMNFSGIAAGQAAICLSRRHFTLTDSLSQGDSWQSSLIMMTIAIIAVSFIIIGLFRWMHIYVLTDPKLYCPKKRGSYKEKAQYKMSIKENFAFLARSKYLIYIALIVLSYNLVINLVEVVWKDQIRLLYPNPNDFNIYMNKVTMVTGIVATLIALFSSTIIHRFGWSGAALISPIIFLVTCLGFFIFLFFREHLYSFLMTLFGVAPVALVVFFGSMQNCFSRACKFTLFDATKELAFIPLGSESKRKGKAAIDGVGSRLGKSGGSLIHQALLMVFASLTASAPYVAGIILLAIAVWIFSVKNLGKEFNALAANHETLDLEAEKTEAVSTQDVSATDPATV